MSSDTARDEVRASLTRSGVAVTSFFAMGLEPPDEAAKRLLDSLQVAHTEHLANNGRRYGMVMAREADTLPMTGPVVRPVLAYLFRDSMTSPASEVYCVNHYEEGETFAPHQDYCDGTVVIITVAGERVFSVFETPEDDVFEGISCSFVLPAWSVCVLDGYRNLGHAARCVRGPSVSVVADVPARIPGAQASTF
jgi:hypothetical protein